MDAFSALPFFVALLRSAQRECGPNALAAYLLKNLGILGPRSKVENVQDFPDYKGALDDYNPLSFSARRPCRARLG